MAIKPRGSKWQIDVTVRDKRVRMSANTKEAAAILESEIKASLLAGRDISVTPKGSSYITMSSLADQVYQRRWAGTKGAQTAWINARSAVEFFGRNFPAADITVERIDEYVRFLENRGNSNATINRKLTALGTMLRHAEERGMVPKVPKMERKQESRGRIRFLTEVEEGLAEDTLRRWEFHEMADLVIVLVDTGLRRGEALGLEPRDIDFTARRLRVWDTKNGESRSVPMTARVVDILRHRTDSELGKVFTLTTHQIRHQWDRMKGHIGLADDEQFVLHTLRHTCASRLVQRGVPLAVVKEWLGHKTLTVTMRYSHLSPSSLDEAARVLESPVQAGEDVT